MESEHYKVNLKLKEFLLHAFKIGNYSLFRMTIYWLNKKVSEMFNLK